MNNITRIETLNTEKQKHLTLIKTQNKKIPNTTNSNIRKHLLTLDDKINEELMKKIMTEKTGKIMKKTEIVNNITILNDLINARGTQVSDKSR